MVTGKVVRYEAGRGYGFIAPDGGGDDVFVHASDLEATREDISCGTRVEFKVVDGGRGLKAYDVRVIGGADDAAVRAAPAARVVRAGDDEDVCEVLSEREFSQEVTETILAHSPSATAGQILEIRKALADMARKHGWLD